MKEPTPFDELHPNDGYQVVASELGRMQIYIQAGIKVGGEWLRFEERAPTVEVWEADTPTAQDYAERARALLLLQAVCQYFNSGGSWPELHLMLDNIRPVITGGITHVGWHLYDTYLDTEGAHTVVWVKNNSDQVVRWVVGSFIDHLTLNDLQNELDQDDDPEADESGIHPFAEVPDSEDTGAEEEDEDEGPRLLPGPDTGR